MQYVRLYADSDGETHFEDVDVPTEAVTTSTGVSTHKGQSEALGDALTFTEVDTGSTDPGAGGWGPWHPDTHRFFATWLQGEVEIEVTDGEVRKFGPGQLLLIEDTEDTTQKGHRNRRISSEMRSIFIPLKSSASA